MSLDDNLGLGHVGNASTGGSQTSGKGGEKSKAFTLWSLITPVWSDATSDLSDHSLLLLLSLLALLIALLL